MGIPAFIQNKQEKLEHEKKHKSNKGNFKERCVQLLKIIKSYDLERYQMLNKTFHTKYNKENIQKKVILGFYAQLKNEIKQFKLNHGELTLNKSVPLPTHKPITKKLVNKVAKKVITKTVKKAAKKVAKKAAKKVAKKAAKKVAKKAAKKVAKKAAKKVAKKAAKKVAKKAAKKVAKKAAKKVAKKAAKKVAKKAAKKVTKKASKKGLQKKKKAA